VSGIIVLGIGNRLGGDDAAGSLVVDALNLALARRSAKLPKRSASKCAEIVAIDVGTAPESYTSTIRKRRPDLLILIDAADMALHPGAVRIVPRGRISALSFSTHHMPLSMFISYVEQFCGRILLVGLQPERTDAGTPLSKAVSASVRKVARAILEGTVTEIPALE